MVNIDEYLDQKYPGRIKKGDGDKYFTSSQEEYNNIKRGVALRVNPSALIIKMEGKDRLDFLHRVSSNSVKDLKPMDKRNTLFLNEKGRFIDRTTLINLENESILIGSADKRKHLYSWISKYIIMEDIQLSDITEKYLVIEIFGAQSDSFLTMLFGKDIKIDDPDVVRRFDVDGFTFHFFLNQENNGVKIYNIIIEREKSIDLIEHLFTTKSVFDLSFTGEDAYDKFRIENGIPAYPNEINDSTNPHEVGLINEINFKKGCYIGQEVIARLDTYDKVQKKMVRSIIDGSFPADILPVPIIDQSGNNVGEVTTISSMNSSNETCGLALIKKKNLEENNKNLFSSNGKKLNLKVIELNANR